MRAPAETHTATPAWLASGFRPFYLLGASFAVLWAAIGILDWSGSAPYWLAPALPWHPHEMVYGFAAAIVVGTVLTALPSWAGTVEVRGAPLLALALAWLVGRLACAASPWLPWPAVAAADAMLLALAALLVTPALVQAQDKRYLLLVPILVWLVAADLAWHGAFAVGDTAGAARALRAALWALVVLYALKGGVLTPVFTGNALVESGRGGHPGWRMPLEVASLALLLALALADFARAPAPVTGVIALGALAAQGWRVARWRGWRVADEPLVSSMNLGFAWLLAALALKAASGLGAPLPEPSWVHAFTIGALGTMMLGLMTRVALRHTGRALAATAVLRLGIVVVSLAAALRVAQGVHGLGRWALVVSMLLWAACFAAWLVRHGSTLVAPSLPAR